jgi:23S rRNA pseudouridine2605 synthase
MAPLRLTRFLSLHGAASRRKSEELVRSGRVKVNNSIVTDLFAQIISPDDVITVDDHIVNRRSSTLYIALYKPRGFLSDLAYEDGRPLARSLIPVEERIYPVGRLDYDSQGLLLFTNDGQFANRIMHPRYDTEREYHVKLGRQLTSEETQRLKEGVQLDDGPARAWSVDLLRLTNRHAWYSLVLKEGRNRIVRRMAESLGLTVLNLKRTRIGAVHLGDLRPGAHRPLTKDEVRSLRGRP